MFNFPNNMSDSKKKRYLRACQFCRDVFIDVDRVKLNLYDDSGVSLRVGGPGIIISKVYLTTQTARALFDNFGINEYFSVKEYKKTIHIILNKKYVDKIDELETLFKLQEII